MGNLGVEIEGLKELNEALSINPLRSTLRLTLSKAVTELHSEIKTIISQNYSIRENLDNVMSRSFVKDEKKNIISVELTYKYKSVRLSAYPVEQYRVTVGKRTLHVTREKKKGFTREIVPATAWATYVKIKKNWVLVVGRHGPDKQGRPGFMGWLHTGKLGRKRFRSAGIYERLQQSTWAAGERLPVVELYGPSFTQILASKEIQAQIADSKAIKNLYRLTTGFRYGK